MKPSPLPPPKILTAMAKDYFQTEVKWKILTGDGSSRQYFLFCPESYAKNAKEKPILGVYFQDEPANERFFHFSQSLKKQQIPLANIYAFGQKTFFLLEYLGPSNLAQCLAEYDQNKDREKIFQAYLQILPWLKKIYFDGAQALKNFPDRIMNKPLYEKDGEYFLEHFVHYFSLQSFWKKEQQDALALCIEKLSHFPSFGFVSRDFQARNIMWQKEKPFFIDFQDAMLGPITYDLASMLYASSSYLKAEEQEKLSQIYSQLVFEDASFSLPPIFKGYQTKKELFFEEFYQVLLLRRLRSLGTYGNLGFRQAKKNFAAQLQPSLFKMFDFSANPLYEGYMPIFHFLKRAKEKLQPLFEK